MSTIEDDINNRLLLCNSSSLSYILGLINTTTFPSNSTTVGNVALTRSSAAMSPGVSNTGKTGTYRWAFPYSVKLSGIYPYLFIQSRALGTDIRVANGNMGYWRMVLNDQVNYALNMVNNRVDTYTNEPLTLKEIDIKLVYPDGTPVNNSGGRFTLLLEIVRLV